MYLCAVQILLSQSGIGFLNICKRSHIHEGAYHSGVYLRATFIMDAATPHL